MKQAIKPVLFNTLMVTAIMAGQKTMTRRLMKPQPVIDDEMWKWKDCQWMHGGLGFPQSGVNDHAPIKVGDVLWVRETWQEMPYGYVYRADYNDDEEPEGWDIDDCWRPSIHMPKEAARLFLHVTDVRVERLHDITDEQALAEGVPDSGDYPVDPVFCPFCYGEGLVSTYHPVSLGFMDVDCERCNTPVKRFRNLWDSINTKRNGGEYVWVANPWVWVISFERCEKPTVWP